MPAMIPIFTKVPTHARPGCRSIASATGSSTLSCAYGTMPVSTAAMARYSTQEMTSAPRMPSGTSRFGLRDSSAVVDAVSKPMYENRMRPAPVMMPLHP